MTVYNMNDESILTTLSYPAYSIIEFDNTVLVTTSSSVSTPSKLLQFDLGDFSETIIVVTGMELLLLNKVLDNSGNFALMYNP